MDTYRDPVVVMDETSFGAASGMFAAPIATVPHSTTGRLPALVLAARVKPRAPVRGGDRIIERSRTLLLVDDEEYILASLRRLFRRDGYRILTANSGLEGLELLGRNDVDVIISDNRMPSMTGIEFLRQAKDAWPECIRMVLSGYTEPQAIVDSVNECAIHKFLTKPWEDEPLRAEVECAFDVKATADEDRRLRRELVATNAVQAELNIRLACLLARQPIVAAPKGIN
jgi:response regulator RpfG family c-di-GMP phosphodiesterase